MVQSEAQKRAKAKYYQKLKENPEYKSAAAKRTKEYYTNNKEKHMSYIIQKTKKSFYNIQRIKERRIKLNRLFLNWKILALKT